MKKKQGNTYGMDGMATPMQKYNLFFIRSKRQPQLVFDNSSKYFSLVMPIMRILFMITNAGTSLYLGITTGRTAPGK
jgi:hypothetical protein